LFWERQPNWKDDCERYEAVLADARKRFQPVGLLEEIQVERIAICELRRKRVFRCETAEIEKGHFRAVALHSENFRDDALFRTAEQNVALKLLKDFLQQIEGASEMPVELKQRLFVACPDLERFWPVIEESAVHDVSHSDTAPNDGSSWKQRLASQTLKNAIRFLEYSAERGRDQIMEVFMEQHAIPAAEVNDRILKYLAGIDREQASALATLALLQDHRKCQDGRIRALDSSAGGRRRNRKKGSKSGDTN
jgi:hypothetical protein